MALRLPSSSSSFTGGLHRCHVLGVLGFVLGLRWLAAVAVAVCSSCLDTVIATGRLERVSLAQQVGTTLHTQEALQVKPMSAVKQGSPRS